MTDAEQIQKQHEKMCTAMIRKGAAALDAVLDESFVLIHMTGMRQSKAAFFGAVMDGTLIDTAAAFFNEADVGKAVRDSGVAREEMFITSKLWLREIYEIVERRGPARAKPLYTLQASAIADACFFMRRAVFRPPRILPAAPLWKTVSSPPFRRSASPVWWCGTPQRIGRPSGRL